MKPLPENTKQERISAQNLLQKFVAIRNYQFALSRGNMSCKPDLEELQKEMRIQIGLWGGIQEIDTWLSTNDVGHQQVSQIQGLNLDWLTNS